MQKSPNGIEYLEFNPTQTPQPAVGFLFHGYGANAHDLYPLGQYLQFKEAVHWFFPNAPLKLAMNPFMDSRAWFAIPNDIMNSMMTGARVDFSYYDTDDFYQMVERVGEMVIQLAAGAPVYLGGFSQGAMLTTHLIACLLKKNITILGAIIYSGVLVGESKIKQAYEGLSLNFPIFQSHGSQDPLLSISGAYQLRDFYHGLNAQINFLEFTGQHEIPMEALQNTVSFINSQG